MSKFMDLSGQKYGRLTVIKRAENHGKFTAWECICECGNAVTVQARHLRNGDTKSCGCYYKDTRHTNPLRHGDTGTELFARWQQMKARCNAKSGKPYKTYSSRGIKVCGEWEHDFPTFKKWAYANGYHPGLSLDRIDNDLGYCPDNCRWIERKRQNYNKRTSRLVTFNGCTKSIGEWADFYGIKYSIFYNRAVNGWDLDDIISKPIDKRFSHARRHMR